MNARVKLETLFLDIIEPIRDYVPESDHLEMLELVVQYLADEGYDLKVLYGNDRVLDESLNHIFGEQDEDDDEDDLYD